PRGGAPALPRGGGGGRPPHTGGVRGRVAAADPHGVAGGRGGEDELLGGLLVVGLHSELRRHLLIVVGATADGQEGDKDKQGGKTAQFAAHDSYVWRICAAGMSTID